MRDATKRPAALLVENVDWQGKTDREIRKYQPLLAEILAACTASDERAWQKRKFQIEDETAIDLRRQPRLFEVRKMPLFFPDGRRKALVVIGRDVTERRQMEEQLSRRGARLRQPVRRSLSFSPT